MPACLLYDLVQVTALSGFKDLDCKTRAGKGDLRGPPGWVEIPTLVWHV